MPPPEQNNNPKVSRYIYCTKRSCQKAIPYGEICPYCNSKISVSLLISYDDYDRNNKLAHIFIPLTVISFLLSFMSLFLWLNYTPVLLVVTLIFGVLGAIGGVYAQEANEKIKSHYPSGRTNWAGFAAKIVAMAVGRELSHVVMGAITSSNVFENQIHNTVSNITNSYSSSSAISDTITANASDVLSDNMQQKFTHNTASHAANNFFQQDISTGNSRAVHDSAGMLDSRIDISNNNIYVSNASGVPTEHVVVNNSTGTILNNTGMATGYIKVLPTHTTLIQDHFGMTEFNVDGNGHIYDTQGILQGTISKAGSTIFLRDKNGLMLKTISG